MMCRQSVVILSAALAVAATATLRADDTDIDKTTLELMAEHGYPAEEHLVTTEDGYILALHRMPYGVAGPGEVPRPVAFLQHGLLGSSSDWLMQPPARSLAYMLADAGYDVWLGNVRGNTYCRSHVNLTADQPQFWKFSWDQMGMYDVPAMIDHILQTTGQEDLYYFGHSMGTTMFWVMLYNHPEYNAKIRLMQALGPVARMDRTTCPLRIFAPYANELEKLAEYIGYDEFLPSDELMTYVAETFCEPDEESQFICNDIMFLLGGYDPEQLNETALPVIISHTPAGTSTRTVVHYAQEIDTAAFIHFDWGLAENLARYGQATPPLYSLEHVTCPVVLAWSDNDLLADPQDVAWLADQLPNVVENFRVPLAAFNHLDFIWAIDADTLLYNHLMENLRNY